MERRQLSTAGSTWLRFLRDQRGLSRTTLVTYRSSLRCAFRLLPDDYSRQDMEFVIHSRITNARTVHVRRSSYIVLSMFFRWWEENGGPESPLSSMVAPVKSKARRRALTEEELAMLSLRLRSATLKDKAMVMLLLFSGFRLGDVVNLKAEDVDFDGHRIRATMGKGGTDVWLPLAGTMADTLQIYMESHKITSGWVFTGPFGRMSTRAVSAGWARVKGPVLKGVVPHMLRHSYASIILRGQTHTDINTLRKLMRHQSLATTQLYLDDDHNAEEAAILNIESRLASWGA